MPKTILLIPRIAGVAAAVLFGSMVRCIALLIIQVFLTGQALGLISSASVWPAVWGISFLSLGNRARSPKGEMSGSERGNRSAARPRPGLYYCPFEMRLCSAKEGGMAVPAVWTRVCPLAAYPSELRSRPQRTGETRCAPLLKFKSKLLLVLHL